jgi:hypothetical protein
MSLFFYSRYWPYIRNSASILNKLQYLYLQTQFWGIQNTRYRIQKYHIKFNFTNQLIFNDCTLIFW